METVLTSRLESETPYAPVAETSPAATVRTAFLLSRYPAISHTFFLHEVLGLRARGVMVETASINPPDRPVSELPAVEAQEAASTFYVKDGHRVAALWCLLTTLVLYPAVVLRGLTAVLRLPNVTLRRRIFWMFYLAEALLVGRWMKRQELGHLHVHFGGPVASVGMLVGAAWRIPYSMTIHGPEELLNHDAYHLREKVQGARFVLCISDFCRSQLWQLVPPSEWDKFEVVRLGVDPLILTPSAKMEGERALELVCTGRLVPEKGHRVLLDALVMLRERGVTLHTTLIGGGPELARLKEYVTAHEMNEQVTLTSALSHPATLALLRRADMFALASFAEGIPVALMEAMSLGVPCVSTTIAGIPELIRSGVDGMLVPPGNAVALADALEQLATDAKLRRTLGAAARQCVISRYNLPLNQELLAHTFVSKVGC